MISKDRILALVVITLALVFLFLIAQSLAIALPVRDFFSFWKVEHLITQNPYSDNIGMRNPPWALPFVLPLGLMSYPSAFAIWSIVTVAILGFCGRVLWGLYRPEPSYMPVIVSMFFGPTITTLMLGQISVLALLGVTIFLWAEKQKRDFFAGASLLLIAVKPNITLVFLLAVLVWTVCAKRWTLISGALISLAACTAPVLVLDPRVYEQYVSYFRSIASRPTLHPNAAGFLYSATGWHALALAPMLGAFVWLGYYGHRIGSKWNWAIHGPIVLLVSLVCSYYSFPYDEVLALPALIAAAALGNRWLFLAGFILTNSAYALYISNVAGRIWGFSFMFLCWTATGWLVTYIISGFRVAGKEA